MTGVKPSVIVFRQFEEWRFVWLSFFMGISRFGNPLLFFSADPETVLLARYFGFT